MNGRRAAAVAASVLLAAGLAGCGGSQGLAKVGGNAITHDQVQRLVESGQEEAVNEGRDFPKRGTAAYRQLEREALGILVARTQIAVAAQRLGIRVSDAEVRRHVSFPRKNMIETLYEGTRRQLGIAEKNEKGATAQLLADAVRVQLTLQKVELRLGAERLGSWVTAARRLPVAYAGGWAP
jgi:parvulin-like peptidyl-prolyl isomerase